MPGRPSSSGPMPSSTASPISRAPSTSPPSATGPDPPRWRAGSTASWRSRCHDVLEQRPKPFTRQVGLTCPPIHVLLERLIDRQLDIAVVLILRVAELGLAMRVGCRGRHGYGVHVEREARNSSCFEKVVFVLHHL